MSTAAHGTRYKAIMGGVTDLASTIEMPKGISKMHGNTKSSGTVIRSS